MAVLAALNLRGVRESGTFFAVPTYLFMVAILGMCAYGLLQLLAGDLPDAESAELQIEPAGGLGGAARPRWRCCSCWPARSPRAVPR